VKSTDEPQEGFPEGAKKIFGEGVNPDLPDLQMQQDMLIWASLQNPKVKVIPPKENQPR